MINFKNEVVNILNELDTGLTEEEIERTIEIPPSYDMGDYAFPCFQLAKQFRKAPNIIAEELAGKIDNKDLFETVKNEGPYINFFINKEKLAETVLNAVYEEKEKYGATNIGEGRKVLVEFSSPNIAKPFHIGHIRSTLIGNALYNLYQFEGFDTVALNHIGDYGTQFGMLIAAIKKWGDEDTRKQIEKDPIHELLKLYVRFNAEAEKDESLRDEARYWFKELEEGNEYAKELWQWIRDLSLKEFERVYEMFGIKFDAFRGEAFYSDKMAPIVEEMEEKGLLKESDGAYIIDLEEYNMPPALIKKSDGSTLYITRDITSAFFRKEHYDFYKSIYVVASEQNLHFKQWMKVIELMGYDWANDNVHVAFGMVSLEDGKLSTRKGQVLFLEDVLNKAVDTALELINDRNPDLENKEEVAKEVGIGAVMFQELFNSRIKDYTFSWEKTLSFEGETGPYVQYAHARTASLLKKGNFDEKMMENIDYSLLKTEEEINLIRLVYDFPEKIINSLDKYEPFIVTRHITEIAQAFSSFYNACPILSVEEELKNARLALTYITKTVIKTGLGLLGIKAPEKM